MGRKPDDCGDFYVVAPGVLSAPARIDNEAMPSLAFGCRKVRDTPAETLFGAAACGIVYVPCLFETNSSIS